jgi:hypothetical protein
VDVERDFRGARFIIAIKNKSGKRKKVEKLIIDGKTVDGNKISEDYINSNKIITVIAEI